MSERLPAPDRLERRRIAAFLAVAFGEVFGWRAYLLPKLLPLGYRRTVVLSGAIWTRASCGPEWLRSSPSRSAPVRSSPNSRAGRGASDPPASATAR